MNQNLMKYDKIIQEKQEFNSATPKFGMYLFGKNQETFGQP
jgi:hypothetical protein